MATQTPLVSRRAQQALQGFLERLRFTLVALVVSTFPETAKGAGWPSVYASAAAHAFGGWVEALASAGLFGIAFLRYVSGFVHSTGWTYLSNKPGSLSYGDFFGTGALGYLSFLFTPVAWVTLFCFVEGIVRALDAALSERMLGMAFVALPWRAIAALRKTAQHKRHQTLLGPERPDEVTVGRAGEPIALTVFTAREKPWSDHQVIEYEHDFFEVMGKRLVERGGYRAYRYDFRHLDHGEVIRGVLLRYPPETPDTPPDAPGGPRTNSGQAGP